MAEEDVMLVAIRMDAKGAITDTQILDDKFKNLSTTFRKGAQETETLTQVTAKQVKATKDANLANIDLSATYLKTLAGLDALTSGLNQGISAQYKMIDAKLAAGDIDEEEAERRRKIWKAREKHTASLEMAIAVMRLATVAHMVYTSVVGMSSTGIVVNTGAVRANTMAWLSNPLFWAIAGIALGIGLMVYALVKLAQQFNVLERSLDGVNAAFELFKDFVQWHIDIAETAGDAIGGFADKLTGKEPTRRIEQEAIS
jgi:hypothetical protein